jgi:hypothetical protein
MPQDSVNWRSPLCPFLIYKYTPELRCTLQFICTYIWYITYIIKYGLPLLPRMVVVECRRVEGWIVGERHAPRQRELEEALVFGRAQQLRLIQLRARALHIQLKPCR